MTELQVFKTEIEKIERMSREDDDASVSCYAHTALPKLLALAEDLQARLNTLVRWANLEPEFERLVEAELNGSISHEGRQRLEELQTLANEAADITSPWPEPPEAEIRREG